MTFLYTVFFPALAAAAIPLLLHFLSRQRLPLVSFSSLEFLQRLQKRQARRVQLRQIILLLLRTLAVLAVVAAFARPALRGAAATDGVGSATEMVVLLDDGFTSSAQSRDGTILHLAAEKVGELLDVAGADDRVTLLPASLRTPAESAAGPSPDLIHSRLTEAVPQLLRPRLREALAIADTILRSSPRFNRELYVVSGFYGEDWDSLEWRPAVAVRSYLLPVGPERMPNAGVERVRLVSAIRQKGRPVGIEAAIRNYGDEPLTELPLGVYLEGERIAQASVEVPAGGVVAKSFSITPAQTGELAGSVRIEDPDPIAADSRRHFVLDVPEKLKLLVVAGDSITQRVLAAVLQTGSGGYYDVTFSTAGRWETQPLEGFDALLLADLPTASGGAAQRVAEFVEWGGGAIVMPGPSSDLADLSRGLLQRLGFQAIKGVLGGGVGWGRFDQSHPIFAGVFEEAGNPRSPGFAFAVDLSTGVRDQVVIPLTNGSPFLIERQVGRGRALLFAAPPSPAAGDFVFRGVFAPLLFRAAAYAASGRSENATEWETGFAPRVVLALPRAMELTLVAPDGGESTLPPRTVLGGVEYEVGWIALSGVYGLRNGESVVSRFAANPPAGLGSLERCDLAALGKRIGGGTVLTASRQQLAGEIAAARYGRELWRPIAAAFIGFLLAESIIGKARKKEGD